MSLSTQIGHLFQCVLNLFTPRCGGWGQFLIARLAGFPSLGAEGIAGRVGLGFFLAGTFSGAEVEVLPKDGRAKDATVVWAFLGEDFVTGTRGGEGLKDFLELAFGVVLFGLMFDSADGRLAVVENEPLGNGIIAVQVDGSDEGFKGIRKGGGTVAATVGFLAFAHEQVGAQIDAAGIGLERFAGDEPGAQLGEFALREGGEERVEKLGEDELNDGVAQELEALIVEVRLLRFVSQAGMSERFREEQGVPELVVNLLLEGLHGS